MKVRFIVIAKLIVLLCLIFSCNCLTGQYATYTDAAYLKFCEGAPDRYGCTDSVIHHSLTEILALAPSCAEMDTSLYFTARWTVNRKGEVESPSLAHALGRDTTLDCSEAVEDDVLLWLLGQSFLPARQKRKRVSTSKRLRIEHNLTTRIDRDSSGAAALLIAEEMPRFNGCEMLSGSHYDKEVCAETKMLMHLYRNLMYPPEARELGIQGMVVIQFVIEQDGRLSNIEIIKEIGGGCGQAAIKAVKSMNDHRQPFIPGRQNGKEVRVQYKMPVRFKLA